MLTLMANPELHPSLTELDLLLSAVPLTEPCSSTPGQIDLLVDGYISHTLTPQYAEKYIYLFTKYLERKWDASLVARDAGWFVVCSKTAQMLHQFQDQLHHQRQRRLFEHHDCNRPPPSPPRSLTPRPGLIKHHPDDAHPHRSCEEAFDHIVDLYRGTIVPQPTSFGVTETTGVICPIYFTHHDGTLGVPYAIAQRGEVRGLLREEMALAPEVLRRNNQNLRMRVQWPGYKAFHYEFRIMDRKLGAHAPVPMFRVVERVARGLHRLYLEGERDPDTFNERWKLGDDDGIHPEEITIIGLLHVSRGTWMPILQLSRHIMPRWDYFKDRLEMEAEAEAEAEMEEGEENPTREGAQSSPVMGGDDSDGAKTEGRKEGKTRRGHPHLQ